MSNTKHLADLLKVCSILPALAIMPAMAGVEDYIWNPNFDSYTLEADEKLPNPDSVENAQFNGMRSPTGKFELDGSNFTLDANGWAGLSVGADEEFNMHDFKMVKNFEKAASGGAFLSITGGVLTIDNVHFMNNSSVGGGAIASGAALAQDGGQAADVAISNSKFTANSATSSGGAISNNASLLKLSNVDFVGNMSGRDGGAVDNNNGGILEISNGAVFKNNIATQNGGAIFAGDVSVIGDILFEENEALNAGAVHVGDKSFVVKKDAQGNDNTVTFKKNVATGNAGAFFVGANGTVDITATNIDFVENSGASNGGTIYVQDGTLKLLGENNTFFNNQSTKSEKTYKRGGGVIHNQINSDGSTIVIGGSENSINSFTYNKAVVNGGAILSRGDGNGYESNMTLNGTTVFEENDAGMNGGALYQYVNAKDTMNVVFNGNVDFDDNNAVENGGAIYNYSLVDGIASIKFNGEVDFENNNAGQNGGAIYNTGTVDLSKAVAEFDGNIASLEGGAIYNQGDMKIAKTEFENNKASVYGGAISNRATMTIQDAKFKENISYGYYGGAIYNAGKGVIDSLGADFENNKVVEDGFAIGGAIANIGKIGDVNAAFGGNTVNASGEDASAKGGAIYTYAGSTIDSLVADFINNKAYSDGESIGGAVVNDGKIAKLHQAGKGFISNTSEGVVDGWAGALYNSEKAVISDLVANFASNTVTGGARAFGGALVNKGTIEGLSGTFVNNVAVATSRDGKAFGGAIYNEGIINFVDDVVFSGNVAHGLSNDIHNIGTLNITGGTTTLDGGVDGITGTFNLAQGATLDIGTSAIKQGTINLDGTVVASLLNDSVRGGTYGRFIGDLTIGENALFNLNVGATGTYNIWGGKIVDEAQVAVGDIYEIAGIDKDGVKIVTKSVADIADAVGISTQAAGAVAGLANSNVGKAHQISLALQDALNAEDTATVERETAKLNPTSKPVAQAASASVQNQVLSLTSGRMAGGVSIGRAGGDEKTQENGFWIQGLFNKSKFGDDFHGYTRGVALGADTLIDNKWTIGGGLAFNNSDVHADSMHTDIDSKTLFLYGQYKPNNWFVNATATYSMSEYTENKTATGWVDYSHTYDVDSYGAQVMTGYDFAPGITTEGGLRYLHIAQEGYTDGLNFTTVDSLDTDFLSGVAGLKYAFAIENDWAIQLRPELRAAMTYDFISDDASATVVMPGVASYKVDGERLSRMGGEFGIGLTALYKGMEVSLMYDLDLHKDYTSQTGMIKFRGKF